ncbi:hypothetical protein RN001_011331 [Aquatica leii]|uniref:Enoyl reductase (ER) domain-containing protein n=1 Tax=Aquatica leii TaxID=1421715 RepID=A0AAN7Q3Z9_9COLE|nr:hypothetical protein RN001_011331 [Aquatica leii]
MEAVEFSLKNKSLHLVQKPIPEVTEPNQILIKVAYAGICGTDLHITEGTFPCIKDEPFTMGHEFSGIVEDVGSEVFDFKPGDKVTVDPNIGCGACHYCNSGEPHYCNRGGISSYIGIFKDGAWAQYINVLQRQVHKLPHDITLEQAVLAEPISCLAHSWDRIAPITVGQKILILGAGVIGNLWVSILHLQGHRRVTVSEPNVNRLELLKRLETGFDRVTPDQLKERHEKNPDYLFDVIIDCSGCVPAIEHAFSLLNKGGKLCLFGMASPQAKMSISPLELSMKEIQIIGLFLNQFSFPKTLGLLESMGDRYLNYDSLGIKTFALKEYRQAIEELKKGSISKAVFKF